MRHLPRFALLAALFVSTSVAACGGDHAPPPLAAAPPRFTDLLNGTVRDSANGAVWQQAVDAGRSTQAGAIAYCASLALDGGGWRLPTKDELLSIVDRRWRYPTIDPTYFPGTPNDWFWSSSTVAGSPSYGWYVSFYDGDAHGNDASNGYRARCVR